MGKLTENQVFVGGVLATIQQETGKGATCYQVIEKINEMKKQGNEKAKAFDTTKINKANATLATFPTKELATKTKVPYNDKIVTLYTLNEKGLETFTNTDKKEDN